MNVGVLILVITLVSQTLGTTVERSCLDYYKKGIKRSGYYHVRNNGRPSHTVYCDMTSEPGSAWTLVESFAFKHKNMHQFTRQPLKSNTPVLPNTPNWNRYRMSRSQMLDLKSQSTHWRVTCNFQRRPSDLHQDYAVARFSDFDALSFVGRGVCKKMVYINIRGHQCAECTAAWYAVIRGNTGNSLHVDSPTSNCQFKPGAGSVGTEDNFGLYLSTSKKFRCTSSDDATTNFWFGGYF